MNNYINNEGYVFERRSLNKDLYYLFCIFSASKRLAEITKEFEYDMAWDFKHAYQEHEIQRLLVSTAIHYRIIYEQTPSLSEGDPDYEIIGDYDWREDMDIVGDWWIEVSDNDPIDLTFREACNKIIHATKFELHEESLSPDLWKKYLLPKITLFGTHQKKKWKIELNIEKFISQAYGFTTMDPYEGI